MSQYGIQKTTVLKNGHNSESRAHAQELLDRLVKHTAPLIERHQWRIQELKEFNPKKQGVLGMNARRGSSTVILIRLQHPGFKNASQDEIKAKNGNSKHRDMSSDTINGFYSWNELLGTMIHELSHMVHSNHSAEFYSFMNELYTEVERDEADGTINTHKSIANTKGIDLQGKGRVLGGHDADITKVAVLGGKINGSTGTVGNNTQELRRLRTAAAEQRRNRNVMTGNSSGNKLGKSLTERRFGADTATMTPAQLSKWAAIQRAKDNESCVVGSHEDEKKGADPFWDNHDSTSSTDLRPTRRDNQNLSALSKANSKSAKEKGIVASGRKGGKSVASVDDRQVIELSPTITAHKTSKKKSTTEDKGRRKRGRKPSIENTKGAAVVDLTLSDDDDDDDEPKVKRKSPSNASKGNSSSSYVCSSGFWECPTCTYYNAASVGIPTGSLRCEMCSYCPSKQEIGGSTADIDAGDGFDPFKTVVSGGHNHWKR